MWFVVTFLGYLTLAIVSILDKFILTNQRVSPLRFVFYSTVFVAPLLLLAPWVDHPLNLLSWLAAVLVGFGFAGGLWTMYLGIEKSEISHIGPFIGGVIPLFILFFSKIFLGDIITVHQTWAILFLAGGSLLIATEYKHQKHNWNAAIFWGISASLFFALSHVASKFLYNQIGFWGGFVWGRGFTGIFGLLLLGIPPLWKLLFISPLQTLNAKKSGGKLTLVAINKVLGVAGLMLVQYAIFLGNVTVVNALAGLQYAFLLILVGLMSRFFPKRFREEYSRAEIVQEIIAIIIIAIGLIFLL